MKERNEEVARAEIKLSNMTRSSEGQNIQTVKAWTKQPNGQVKDKTGKTDKWSSLGQKRQTLKAWTKQPTDKQTRLGQNSEAPNKVKGTTYKSEGQIRIQKK